MGILSRSNRALKNRELPGGQTAFLLALCVWSSVLFAPLRISNPDRMRDFEVYWTAASRALDGAPLYRASDEHFQFKYLPAFAVVATPAALVPLDLAKGKWLTISVALLIALVVLSILLLPERIRRTSALVVIVFIAMAKFYGHELTLGQVNLAFATLVATAIYLIGSGRPALAAAMLVAAVVVKPYAVLFLPWVVVRGGWRAAISVAIGMVAVLLAPVGLYGFGGTIDLHTAWWATVTTSTAPNLTNPDNVSLAAFAAKWIGVGTAASVLAAVASLSLLAVAGYAIARGGRIHRREVLEGALLLTLIPMISPQGWDYVFLVSTPAIALLANYDVELPGSLRVGMWIAVAVIGFSLFDLLGRQNYRTFMDWSVITICFLVVIAALVTLRARRVA